MEWETWVPALTVLLGALVLLIQQRVPKFVFGKAEAPKKEDNYRKDLGSQTFRAQGIPAEFEGHETTKSDVVHLVRGAYTVESDIQIYVQSLAKHPRRKGEKVATLSFSKPPLRLLQTPKSAQTFDGVPGSKVQLDIHFHGLTPLHSNDNPECSLEIVALSGLNGHAFGSFKKKGGEYMWLRDDLCNSLPNVRVFIYGYKTEMVGSDSFQSLDDLGISFKQTLKALLAPNDSNRSPNPLVLIGHSLGGLVIKQALCHMAAGTDVEELSILKSVHGIMFFGTPNQGMDISSLVPMVQGQANEGFVRSLETDSPILRMQTNQWSRVFQAREGDKVSSVLEIISFYETRNSPTAIKVDGKWKMGGQPAKLVDRNSATHGQAYDTDGHYVQPIDRNHSELVKFTSANDEIYNEKVLPLLDKFYNTAKDRSPVLLLSRTQQNALEHCRSSLFFPEEQTHAGQIVVAENNTCNWFPKHPIYQEWLQQHRGLLWLQGLPGAGKSTLMKHAAELAEKNATKATAVASFFIYGLGTDLQKTLRGLYCSLIRQLIPQIPFAFLPMIAKAKEVYEPKSWGPLDLQKFFKDALSEASKTHSIILFIDALDEFSTADKERETLLDILRDLCYGKKESDFKINICVSARYHPNLYNKGVIIPVEQNNRNDITTFVKYNLEDLPEQKKIPLEENIIERANGVFQWANVVCIKVRELHRKGKKLSVIMSTTMAIPQDLHSLYERLFDEMDAEDMAQSLKLFRWVGFSNRMLNLRELQHALVLAPDMPEQTLEECRNSEIFLDQLEDLKNSIKNLSKGLIGFEAAHERDGNQAWGERVRLIHVTVMDFLCDRGLKLLEKGAKNDDTPPEGAAHFYITRSLLRYMSMRGTREEFDTLQQSHSQFPLDHFVGTSVPYHLKSAEQYGVDQFELIRIFGWPNEKAAMASFRAFITRVNESPLINMLAEFGVLSALRALINYSPDDLAAGHNQEMFSLVQNCEELLRDGVFLPSGQVNLDITASQNLTPLLSAIAFGQSETSVELIQSGRVDVNACGAYYQNTPFLLAAHSGMEEVVLKLLENPSMNYKAQDVDGNTALHKAVEGSKEDMLKLLLKINKINPNTRRKDGYTPLHMAANAADVDIVDILLQSSRVDVNTKDKNGRTPLFAFILGYGGESDASEHGELAEVLLHLLGHPMIEPGAKDKNLCTPLFYAAKVGLEVYVRILIEDGRVSAADKNKMGRTPLSQAAMKGHEEIVRRFLAAENFDVETLQFAYQEAKKNGKIEVMRMLVGTGKLI